ncbi:DUF3598 family protein [Crocosphaera sp. Alani8]|uniref:DUF3598 family protein n=1 Tax=Crocosphaera sp. Alani8 TaxID=3038952 RepID=UPI00313D9D2C
MDLKVQNWKNFTDQHLFDWYGVWTRYTPTGDVQESFRSLRRFQGNAEQTEIHQLNRYIYAEDNCQEKTWNYSLSEHSLADGMFHPQSELMRGYFFPSGHATWTVTQLLPGEFFAVELFFRNQHIRHSVGIVYDDQGNLMRVANIREDSTGYPSSFWSTEIEQLSSSNLPNNLQGVSMLINSDLEISDPVTTQFTWNIKGHKIFYLPDGVSISCPENITQGTSFSCVANWLINDMEMQQLIASYSTSGKFESLTLERYDLKQ